MFAAIRAACRAALLAMIKALKALGYTLAALFGGGGPADDEVPPALDTSEIEEQEAAAESLTPAFPRAVRPHPIYDLAANIIDWSGDRLFARGPEPDEVAAPPLEWPEEIKDWAGILSDRERAALVAAGTMRVFDHLSGTRPIEDMREFPLRPRRIEVPTLDAAHLGAHFDQMLDHSARIAFTN